MYYGVMPPQKNLFGAYSESNHDDLVNYFKDPLNQDVLLRASKDKDKDMFIEGPSASEVDIANRFANDLPVPSTENDSNCFKQHYYQAAAKLVDKIEAQKDKIYGNDLDARRQEASDSNRYSIEGQVYANSPAPDFDTEQKTKRSFSEKMDLGIGSFTDKLGDIVDKVEEKKKERAEKREEKQQAKEAQQAKDAELTGIKFDRDDKKALNNHLQNANLKMENSKDNYNYHEVKFTQGEFKGMTAFKIGEGVDGKINMRSNNTPASYDAMADSMVALGKGNDVNLKGSDENRMKMLEHYSNDKFMEKHGDKFTVSDQSFKGFSDPKMQEKADQMFEKYQAKQKDMKQEGPQTPSPQNK